MSVKKTIGLALNLLFLIVAIAFFIDGTNNLLIAKKSNSWTKTKATITQSEIIRDYIKTNSKTVLVYQPSIKYKYIIENEPYTGDRIKFGLGKTSDKRYSKYYVEKYKIGNMVDIYYDSKKPSASVIEPGVHSSTWSKPIMSLFLAIFPIIFITLGYFKNRKSQ